jgi:predicted outer membrane protein
MITIKITNAKQIVERERNWLVAKFAPHFINVQTKVEQEIAKEIKKSLEERNFQAIVSVVKDD